MIVFARAPGAPLKTRLRLPPDEAEALHLAFVDDVCRLARGAAARRVLALDGPADARLRAIADREAMALGRQGEGDLGARMDRAITGALAEGAARVVVVGADLPTLPPARLREAFAALAGAEVVLGPALDGGYYLVGARRPAPWLFDGIAWGGDGVLAATLERLALRGVACRLLAPHPDVDTPEDLAALRRALAASSDPALAPSTRRLLAGRGSGADG